MNTKMYTTAPLPFMGQKRRFVKQFNQALKEFENVPTFVDLFGGSGLLSHTAKRIRPDAQVIYNDYDNYHLRLLNVDRTNRILENIRNYTVNCKTDKKLPTEVKEVIIAYLKEQE